MTLPEILATKTEALKVAEVAELLRVTPQHIYKMAAKGIIPSFTIGAAIRFDPHCLADWLQKTAAAVPKQRAARAASRFRNQRSA